MRDNRGFSLIELMIAVTIIAVLAGTTSIGRNLLMFADAKRCANEIDHTLGKLKLETMSRGDKKHYLVIEWNNTEHRYYLNTVSSDLVLSEANWESDADTINRKKLADDSILINYTEHLDGSNIKTIDASNPCVLISIIPGSGTYESPWKQVTVSSNSETLTIHMVTETGKHYIS